jgi:hypothetical protein
MEPIAKKILERKGRKRSDKALDIIVTSAPTTAAIKPK